MPTKNERISLVNDTEEVTAVKAPPPGLIRESRMVALDEPFPIGDPAAPGAKPPPVATGASAATPATPGQLRAPTPATANALPLAPPLSRTLPLGPPPSKTLSLGSPPSKPLTLDPTPSKPLSPGAPTSRTLSLTPPAPSSAPADLLPGSAAARGAPAPSWPPRPLTSTLSAPRPPISAERAAIAASAISSPHTAADRVPLDQSSGHFLAPTGEPRTSRSPSRIGIYAALIGLLVAGGALVGWRQWWSVRPGRVEISTTPSGAVVTVGGEAALRRSPVVLEKAPGIYTISVAHEGYLRSERTIDLHAGQEVMLSIALALVDPSGGKTPIAVAELPGARPPAPAPRHFPGGTAVAAARPPSAPRGGPAHGAAAGPPGVAHLFVMSEGSTPAATPAASTAAPGVAGTAPADDAIAAARAAEAAAAPPTAPHDTPATPAPAAPARADSPPSAADVPAAAGEARATRGAEGGPAARTIAGRLAKAQLAIDPNADEYRVRLPPSLARADMKLSAVVKMCVSSDGKVTDVKLLKSADPAIDPQIPATLGRWRYRPLMVGGQAVPFCYVQQYEIAAD